MPVVAVEHVGRPAHVLARFERGAAEEHEAQVLVARRSCRSRRGRRARDSGRGRRRVALRERRGRRSSTGSGARAELHATCPAVPAPARARSLPVACGRRAAGTMRTSWPARARGGAPARRSRRPGRRSWRTARLPTRRGRSKARSWACECPVGDVGPPRSVECAHAERHLRGAFRARHDHALREPAADLGACAWRSSPGAGRKAAARAAREARCARQGRRRDERGAAPRGRASAGAQPGRQGRPPGRDPRAAPGAGRRSAREARTAGPVGRGRAQLPRQVAHEGRAARARPAVRAPPPVPRRAGSARVRRGVRLPDRRQAAGRRRGAQHAPRRRAQRARGAA